MRPRSPRPERTPKLGNFRCTVMQHLGVLAKASLLIAARDGRVRGNDLDVAPLQEVHARWIAPYSAEAAGLMHGLKADLEG